MPQLVRQSSPNVKQMMRSLLPTGIEEREVEVVPGSPSEPGPVEQGPVAAVAANSFGLLAFLVYNLVLVCAIPHLHTAAAGTGERLVLV